MFALRLFRLLRGRMNGNGRQPCPETRGSTSSSTTVNAMMVGRSVHSPAGAPVELSSRCANEMAHSRGHRRMEAKTFVEFHLPLPCRYLCRFPLKENRRCQGSTPETARENDLPEQTSPFDCLFPCLRGAFCAKDPLFEALAYVKQDCCRIPWKHPSTESPL